MSIKKMQDILPLIEQPSIYLGSEINTIKKEHAEHKFKIALAFPDLYELGTSHFGIQILYHIINKQPDCIAERVFAPRNDMIDYLRKYKVALASLETGTPLGKFDIIGFSLLYELNYTNILMMLDLAGIPFRASQRDNLFPLIIAGGPCTCNPEPVADFFDAMVIGDGENVIMEMMRLWKKWKKKGGTSREALLEMWSVVEGVYIPSFFSTEFDAKGFQILKPQKKEYSSVKKAMLTDLNRAPFPDAPVIPFGKPVHDRLRLEIARGCTRGCRFCQAGMIYRPVRERSVETLMKLVNTSLSSTGYDEISLLSLSTGDYTAVGKLMEVLMQRCEGDHIAVSLPSLRAGALTPELLKQIKKVRKTGFTIAPEAGSQRLRDVINKNISEKEICDTVSEAFQMGWRLIKLYFMIGLPTETWEDLDAIVNLVDQLRKKGGPGKRRGKSNVSITTMIPKPHTPFQWFPQVSLEESAEKIRKLKARLKMPGIHVKWQDPNVSLIEGLWSRGDRSLSMLLEKAYEKGCRFDGWSDQFNFIKWQEAIDDAMIDMVFFTTRARTMDEPFPWDHIDMGVAKGYLTKEYQKAETGGITDDCRWGQCTQCGVCDFEKIRPHIFKVENTKKGAIGTKEKIGDEFFQRLKITYSKMDDARFFGHLEMVKIIIRAINRAGIAVKYSKGFHPMPQISFEDPLPIGTESLDEKLFLTVSGYSRADKLIKSINSELPEGLTIKGCEVEPRKVKGKQNEIIDYLISSEDDIFKKDAIEQFIGEKSVVITRLSKKGKLKKINLKDIVIELNAEKSDRLMLKIKKRIDNSARPDNILKKIFNLSEREVKGARIVKIISKKILNDEVETTPNV
ncbi:MAG: TIGR03960 family B12-binding radical SAM protein [Deltaproteobacteria bacterium]|nr:TIGR03960 family B12-binding radical SAM protein [Deltaproteobacteria bacterium]